MSNWLKACYAEMWSGIRTRALRTMLIAWVIRVLLVKHSHSLSLSLSLSPLKSDVVISDHCLTAFWSVQSLTWEPIKSFGPWPKNAISVIEAIDTKLLFHGNAENKERKRKTHNDVKLAFVSFLVWLDHLRSTAKLKQQKTDFLSLSLSLFLFLSRSTRRRSGSRFSPPPNHPQVQKCCCCSLFENAV